MPSNHLILFLPLLLPSVFSSIRGFSKESVLFFKWPEYWSFSFRSSPSNDYSELISFRIDWIDLRAIQGTLKSFLQHQFESISSLVLNLLYRPIFTSIHDYWKNLALTMWTFVGNVISLLFNMLSRFVIAFRPRNKCLLISWLGSPYIVIFEPKKIKSATVYIFPPSFCHEVMILDAMILVF